MQKNIAQKYTERKACTDIGQSHKSSIKRNIKNESAMKQEKKGCVSFAERRKRPREPSVMSVTYGKKDTTKPNTVTTGNTGRKKDVVITVEKWWSRGKRPARSIMPH